MKIDGKNVFSGSIVVRETQRASVPTPIGEAEVVFTQEAGGMRIEPRGGVLFLINFHSATMGAATSGSINGQHGTTNYNIVVQAIGSAPTTYALHYTFWL